MTKALSAAGARVVMACRDPGRAAQARSTLPHASRVQVQQMDLASLASVRQFADALDADQIDLLVANAGVMAVDQGKTVDGFETHFGVNYLGHFALVQALRPRIEATVGARVVSVSSMAHKRGRINFDDLMGQRRYHRWRAYAQSKLALLLFTAELQQQFVEAGRPCSALAAHPGTVRSHLGRQGSSLFNRLVVVGLPLVGQAAASGALPILRAATDPPVRGGELYGPRWLFRGAPVLEVPALAARDTAVARRLWLVSEDLIAGRA